MPLLLVTLDTTEDGVKAGPAECKGPYADSVVESELGTGAFEVL
jgi:hypothetical protein